MKRSKILILVFISILYSRDFTIADPPMIYIYHFVSYDTTSIILNGGTQDENKNKFLGFSFFKKDDMSFGSYFFKNGENLLMKPLDPKLVSAMVTSAVARNPHVHIAGESIQKRIKTDNFLNLINLLGKFFNIIPICKFKRFTSIDWSFCNKHNKSYYLFI